MTMSKYFVNYTVIMAATSNLSIETNPIDRSEIIDIEEQDITIDHIKSIILKGLTEVWSNSNYDTMFYKRVHDITLLTKL